MFAVTSGIFNPNEHKVVEDMNKSKSIIQPQKGDLLFSRANTRELVAAVCMVHENTDKLFLPDKLWRIRTGSKVQSEYLLFVLSNKRFRYELTKKATGTSGSMLNVSKQKLLEMIIPIPPESMQLRFKQLYWQCQKTWGSLNKSKSLSNSLNSSLASSLM